MASTRSKSPTASERFGHSISAAAKVSRLYDLGAFQRVAAAAGAHAGARLPALQAAPSAKADSGRVFALFLGRGLAVLSLARGNVHNGLGELVGVAGALLAAKLARSGGAAFALESLKGLVVDRWASCVSS